MSLSSIEENYEKPLPSDFIAFVPFACKWFQMAEDVRLHKEFDDSMAMLQTPHKKVQARKSTIGLTLSPGQASVNSSIDPVKDSDPKNTIIIRVIYDHAGNITQLKFNHKSPLPRTLLQVIAMTLEHYKQLNILTFSSGVNKYTIFEISNFITTSYITDVCFDNCDVFTECNYDVLLDHAGLKNISLARCGLDDDFVIRFASKMHFPKPGSKTLMCLNLSSNTITDVGAKSLAEVLRMNRQMTYLNLSGNRITDTGAVSILSVLSEFPLTVEEILQARKESVEYKKTIWELTRDAIELLKESSPERGGSGKGASLRRKNATINETDTLEVKAKAKAMETAGNFDQPYEKSLTVERGGFVFSLGNLKLSYLNLAFNNLTMITVKNILEVLEYQKVLKHPTVEHKGLIRIIIEGNRLPSLCDELDQIVGLLEEKIMFTKKITSRLQLRSARKSIKSIR